MNVKDYGWTEQAPESTSYINPVILQLARKSGARTVIDAGCGNGVLADFLQRNGFQVKAIDSDANGIAIATRKFPAVRFAIGSFGEPSDEQVDLVVSTEVIEHLYSPHELGNYSFSALRPGGTLMISTPYHGFLKNLALALTDSWDKHLTVNWHGGHIKFWSRKTLTEMLTRAGFEVTGFAGVGRFPYLWKSMILIARKPEA